MNWNATECKFCNLLPELKNWQDSAAFFAFGRELFHLTDIKKIYHPVIKLEGLDTMWPKILPS